MNDAPTRPAPGTLPDAAALEAVPDGLVIVDLEAPDAPIVYASRAFLDMTGYAADEVLGRNCRFMQGEGTDPAAAATIRRAIEAREPASVTLLNYRKDGTAFWNELKLSPVVDADRRVRRYVGLQADVTERVEREAGVEVRASHDALTGLANRAALFDALGRAMAAGGSGAGALHALFVDLDGFKAINDMLGHRVGDALLAEVAVRLRGAVRTGDEVARLGGDEFVIVVGQGASTEAATTVAGAVLAALREPFAIEGGSHRIGASVGIAAWPDDAADPAGLVQRADSAMYHAKANGGDGFAVFHPAMGAGEMERLAMRAAIARALERGEFELFYQPIVEAEGGRISGAEALLRWRHPELGLTGPERVVRVAEQTGQIVPLGLWVLEAAVHQSRAWVGRVDERFRIAINVSARQLQDRRLIEALEALPDDAVARLELEITESAVLDGRRGVLEAIEAVRRRGARLSLDDFGTGHSSLRTLADFPVDTVKIDRSFVATDLGTARNGALVDSIFGLARDFGAGVVAEGIETGEQLAFVRARGCRRVQGFGFARPMPAADFEALYARRRGRPAGLARGGTLAVSA